jgi:hypothetical protein
MDEALAKCVKKLLYKMVRARLGTRPPPDRMNTESLRRWAKRLTDQSTWKALGKRQTAWSDLIPPGPANCKPSNA